MLQDDISLFFKAERVVQFDDVRMVEDFVDGYLLVKVGKYFFYNE